MNYPVWRRPTIGCGWLIVLIESLAHRKRQAKFRFPVLLFSILVLLGADREAFCRPLVAPGVQDKPGTEQALATHLTGGFFRSPPPPATGREASRSRDRLLFEQNCTLCHTTDLVKERTAGWSRSRIRTALDQLNRLHPAMPDYRGTLQEKDLLADYIHLLNNPEPAAGR